MNTRYFRDETTNKATIEFRLSSSESGNSGPVFFNRINVGQAQGEHKSLTYPITGDQNVFTNVSLTEDDFAAEGIDITSSDNLNLFVSIQGYDEQTNWNFITLDSARDANDTSSYLEGYGRIIDLRNSPHTAQDLIYAKATDRHKPPTYFKFYKLSRKKFQIDYNITTGVPFYLTAGQKWNLLAEDQYAQDLLPAMLSCLIILMNPSH